jgi:hypothetical protein
VSPKFHAFSEVEDLLHNFMDDDESAGNWKALSALLVAQHNNQADQDHEQSDNKATK